MILSTWLRQRRIGQGIHRWMAWWRLYTTRFDHPRLIELPPGRRIVTLSPHPDDDAIGAGGTLLKHHQAGCHLTTIVLTDGAAGDPGQSRAKTIQTRKAEAQDAAAHLGIDHVIFLGETDGGLAADERAASHLRDWLQESQPNLLYLPFFIDSHPDHRATTALLARAATGSGWRFTCCAYETWTPLLPNVLVDVSDQMETKLRAVGEHRRQLLHVDYPGIIQGLNRYRTAQFSRQIAYAEAFYMAELPVYLALWRQMHGP